MKSYGDIDTAKESFWASVMIREKWREPKLNGKKTLLSEQLFQPVLALYLKHCIFELLAHTYNRPKMSSIDI